jgi:hypothetical protein
VCWYVAGVQIGFFSDPEGMEEDEFEDFSALATEDKVPMMCLSIYISLLMMDIFLCGVAWCGVA